MTSLTPSRGAGGELAVDDARSAAPNAASLAASLEAALDQPEIAAAWDTLLMQNPAHSVFQSREWAWAAAQTVDRNVAPAAVVIRDGAGGVVALLPAGIARRRGARWLRLLGHDRVCGDHLGLLSAPAQTEACLAALGALLDRASPFDGLDFGGLDDDSPLAAAMRRWSQERGWPLHVVRPTPCPYISLPDSFERYVDGLSPNMRYHVRRRRRQLDARGCARVERAQSPELAREALCQFFALHARRWARDGRPGAFAAAEKRVFLDAFVQRAAERGWLRCHRLRVDGACAGVLLAFRLGPTTSFYQMGWAPDAAVDSPGVLLLSTSIADAIAEGCTRYDLLRGDEAYKWKWTDTAVTARTYRLALRPAARAAIFADRCIDAAKSVVRRAALATRAAPKPREHAPAAGPRSPSPARPTAARHATTPPASIDAEQIDAVRRRFAEHVVRFAASDAARRWRTGRFERGLRVGAELRRALGRVAGLRVLDVGGAHGGDCAALAALGAHCTLADYRDYDYAALRAALPPGLAIDTAIFDCNRAWPLQGDAFDAVLALSVVEHVPNLRAFAAEVARVLKPGGVALVETASALRNAPRDNLYGLPLVSLLPTPLRRFVAERIFGRRYEFALSRRTFYTAGPIARAAKAAGLSSEARHWDGSGLHNRLSHWPAAPLWRQLARTFAFHFVLLRKPAERGCQRRVR